MSKSLWINFLSCTEVFLLKNKTFPSGLECVIGTDYPMPVAAVRYTNRLKFYARCGDLLTEMRPQPCRQSRVGVSLFCPFPWTESIEFTATSPFAPVMCRSHPAGCIHLIQIRCFAAPVVAGRPHPSPRSVTSAIPA